MCEEVEGGGGGGGGGGYNVIHVYECYMVKQYECQYITMFTISVN